LNALSLFVYAYEVVALADDFSDHGGAQRAVTSQEF
jgi:hypothetical protein